MVSGGGGGSDDALGTFGTGNDGSGGAGGGLIAQGYFESGKIVSKYLAKQKTGYSFGNGENGQRGESKHPDGNKENRSASSDIPGAGGGWFGGFASFNCNGGSGGGSSFALTYDAQYPTGIIHVYDGYYNDTGVHERYAFQRHQYLVTNPTFVPGIWVGNGMVRITPLSLEHKIIVSAFTCKYRNRNNHQVLVYIILISSKQ